MATWAGKFGRKAAVALVVAACCIGAASCGGGSDTSSTSTASGGGNSKASEATGENASADFLGPGLNGTLASFGKESSSAEREAASKVLEANFEAREAKDWAAQCASLTDEAIEAIEAQKIEAKGDGCAQKLAASGSGASKAVLKDPMTGSVAVLRVEGAEAFAFFHGTGGIDYVIPMKKVGGQWKVGAVAPQEAP